MIDPSPSFRLLLLASIVIASFALFIVGPAKAQGRPFTPPNPIGYCEAVNELAAFASEGVRYEEIEQLLIRIEDSDMNPYIKNDLRFALLVTYQKVLDGVPADAVRTFLTNSCVEYYTRPTV